MIGKSRMALLMVTLWCCRRYAEHRDTVALCGFGRFVVNLSRRQPGLQLRVQWLPGG